jgi:ribosomal protein S18 acetylase RimI-like enzyme
MQFDKFTKPDIERIRDLQPAGWPDIAAAFSFYTGNDYCYPVKVEAGNDIIAVGVSIAYEDTAWLAHIIVDESCRKQGIGFNLVKFLLDDLHDKGLESVTLIATDLGEPVYRKVGFRKVSDYRFFKKAEALEAVSFSDKIKPYSGEYYEDIVRLDKQVNGEGRARLFAGHLHDALVFIDNREVCGFYIPGLGEGPVCARTVEAGTELMRLKYSTVEKAVIPEENTAGIEFLKKLGFTETEIKGKRMAFGKDIPWRPEMIYSRIGGNLG